MVLYQEILRIQPSDFLYSQCGVLVNQRASFTCPVGVDERQAKAQINGKAALTTASFLVNYVDVREGRKLAPKTLGSQMSE